MRALWIGACLVALVGACSERPQTEAAAAGGISLRGQVPIVHPPGDRDAMAKVRQEAAERCPSGFVIKSLNVSQAAAVQFQNRVVNYDAVVECGATTPR